MAEDLSHLKDEVSRLDANEQREEAEISTLKAEQADLQTQLDLANAGGNQAEIDAAAARLETINARIEALVGASADTTATMATTTDTPPTTGG